MSKHHLGVLIGRFQPFHFGHWHLVKYGLAQCEKVLILVGSPNRARSAKNPFSYAEREKLISDAVAELSPQDASRIIIQALNDDPYREQDWIEQVKNIVASVVDPFPEMGAVALNANVALVSHDKDESTYYLKHFADWAQVDVDNYQGLNATHVRQAFFEMNHPSEMDQNKCFDQCPKATIQFLKQFYQGQHYQRLRHEYEGIKAYKASWAGTPYTVLFNTTDVLVTCNDHMLLIQRKFWPGEGLYALPGGFLEAHEWIEEGLLRELREETAIELSDELLSAFMVAKQVFDKPSRSQIGRVITHGAHIALPGRTPPKVMAQDDAKSVQWVPISQLDEMVCQFHDDHYFIIKYFFSIDG